MPKTGAPKGHASAMVRSVASVTAPKPLRMRDKNEAILPEVQRLAISVKSGLKMKLLSKLMTIAGMKSAA